MCELRQELLSFIETPAPEAFDDLAMRVAQRQSERIPAYGRWVKHRGGFTHWREVPWVPTEAFRRLDLCADPPRAGQQIFETSGTTSGVPGRRRAPDLSLYHAAMTAPFLRAVLEDDPRPRPWISLIPEARALPTSSLSHMVSGLAERYADPARSSWHLHADGLDARGAMEALRGARTAAVVLSTSFALINLLDAWEGPSARLPEGTRLMLTGGFKGRSRSLEPSELAELIDRRLGIGPRAIIGEYGMTEWTSQAYGAGVTPALEAPPWLKLRVIEPGSWRDAPPGQPGLVAAFDLLNLDNVSAILTSDLGVLDSSGRLSLVGRAPAARPRGCGLTALDWGMRT